MNYNYNEIPIKLIDIKLYDKGIEQEIALNDRYELWIKEYDAFDVEDFEEEEGGFWQMSVYDIALEEEVAVVLQDGDNFILEGLI